MLFLVTDFVVKIYNIEIILALPFLYFKRDRESK